MRAAAVAMVVVLLTVVSALADVGVLSIGKPGMSEVVDRAITPSGIVKNFSGSEVTASFEVTCEIVDESMVAVYSDTVVHSGSIAAGATDVVTFVDTWLPTELGVYTVTMATALAGDANPTNDSLEVETEVVEHYGTGGPDAMGYEWIDSGEPGGPVYDWIEISETGTSTIMYGVPTFAGDENFSEPIPFGFTFPFYGIGRTHMYVDTNGEILLTENGWYEPYPDSGWDSDGFFFNYVYPIPGFTQMPALVAPLWDDLEAIEGTGDTYFQTFGEAPNRYCVVEWHNFTFGHGTVEEMTLTFEVIFHENGDMVFQYQDVVLGQTGTNAPHDEGRSATVGIQNDTADIGLCYVREIVVSGQYQGIEPPGNFLVNELAIRFSIDIDEQAPAFVYDREIGNTFDTTPGVSLTITDASGVMTDSLYYNYGEGWAAVTHVGFEAPNTYHYELPEVPVSTELQYYFAATDSAPAGNRATLPAGAPAEYYSIRMLPTDGVEVLLAHPGTVPGYEDWQNIEFPEFVMALDAADVVYDIYNWAEYETYRFTENYSTIFVYSNTTGSGAETDTLSAALIDFLNSGTTESPTNLFLASDEFANAQHAISYLRPMKKFFRGYLRGLYVPDGTVGVPPHAGTDGIGGPYTYDYSYGSIIGWAGSPIGDEGVELPVYSNSPDVIVNDSCPESYWDEVSNPELWSWASFSFQDGPYSGYAYAYELGAGIWLDNLIYKSFFLTFDLSQFTSEADRKMLIQDAVDWFGVPTGVDDPGDDVVAGAVTLAQNCPNPFNPVTTIAYSIPAPAHVTVEVYNVSGQRTATLVDEDMDAGTHEVLWRGRNDDGESVGSGIYFYRITVGEFSSSRKMILLK